MKPVGIYVQSTITPSHHHTVTTVQKVHDQSPAIKLELRVGPEADLARTFRRKLATALY